MQIKETVLKGCYELTPTLFEDHRGYFFESFNKRNFEEAIGYSVDFVQDNQSQSSFGVIRGLHLQVNKSAQAKLVRAIEGTILDVVVDVRTKSKTFGKHLSVILSEENKKQLFVPKWFAHGFAVLSPKATIHYKADNYYSALDESGILYKDTELNIDWQLNEEQIIVSNKDLNLPMLNEFKALNNV